MKTAHCGFQSSSVPSFIRLKNDIKRLHYNVDAIYAQLMGFPIHTCNASQLDSCESSISVS